MRIRISRRGARRALAILPLTAVVGALAWPASSDPILTAVAVEASPTSSAAGAPAAPLSPAPTDTPTDCLIPGSPICASPSPTATAKPTAKPTATPAKPPTAHPTAGGPRPPATTVPPTVTPADPGSLVGQGSGPPAPPSVPGSRIDFQADPQAPGPGESTVLTVTVSGSRGGDRYAVPNVDIELTLSEKPDQAASLSTTSLTSDVTGSALTRLTLSRTKGRHVVTATSGGASSHIVFDTLAGSTAGAGRARHSAGFITTVNPPVVNPALLFTGAAIFLVGGFLFPYRRRVMPRLRGGGGPIDDPEGPPDAPAEVAPVPADQEPSVSSGRKPRAARRSAAPGG